MNRTFILYSYPRITEKARKESATKIDLNGISQTGPESPAESTGFSDPQIRGKEEPSPFSRLIQFAAVAPLTVLIPHSPNPE